MADTKISAMTAATTLGSTDELVLSVSGANKKITGANLMASLPAGAMTLLTTDTVAGSAAPLDRASISGSYNDLMVVAIIRGSYSGPLIGLQLQLNNDTGSNYLWQRMEGTGTSAVAQSSSGAAAVIRAGEAPGTTATASYFSYTQILIPGYTSTSWNKTVNVLNGGASDTTATGQWTNHMLGQWNNTAAVTRVKLFTNDGAGGNLVIGSTMRIYGIL
jgi:hypothetical protein